MGKKDVLFRTSISSWCSRCCGRVGRGGLSSSLSAAHRDISHMDRIKDKQVTGRAGTDCNTVQLVTTIIIRIAAITTIITANNYLLAGLQKPRNAGV